MTDVFSSAQEINKHIEIGDEKTARDELIKLLDYMGKNKISYNSLVNHLIRKLGLYPYLQTETAAWDDCFAYEAFKVNVGENNPLTLHREQSRLLKKLLDGENLAISAPTSFGKSFIIDAFIAIRKPNNIVIIVPTIALTDETRRRLHKKFSSEYKIITTPNVELSDRNIFVFPQERAISYADKFKEIDMLIIDEFYKVSSDFDKERASALQKAILKLGIFAKQKYYLSPNISSLKDSLFTKGMTFEVFDFNTVFLERHDLHSTIKEEEKDNFVVDILTKAKVSEKPSKSLIYAGTYTGIEELTISLIDKMPVVQHNDLLSSFSDWLINNYGKEWNLSNLIKRGIGVHNGRLHRSLSQIQVRLFEEKDGLEAIVSTSSIIEGVNTSAENIIIWSNRNGPSSLNDFTYKNIIGRGGRMFKHFIGKIYILEKPPLPTKIPLNIEMTDDMLLDVDEKNYRQTLTKEQVAKIIEKKREMEELLGVVSYDEFIEKNPIQSANALLIKEIVTDMLNDQEFWRRLRNINSDNPDRWDNFLYKALGFLRPNWSVPYGNVVTFIKVLSNNWLKSVPELLSDLTQHEKINIELFFKLERGVTFELSSLLGDINILQKKVFPSHNIDIAPFVSKLSSAFLPPIVYQLEEYGLPRMISKKIQENKIFDFTSQSLTLHDSLMTLKERQDKISSCTCLNDFDRYILKYFFEGI